MVKPDAEGRFCSGEQSGHRLDQQHFGDGARQQARGRHGGRVRGGDGIERAAVGRERAADLTRA